MLHTVYIALLFIVLLGALIGAAYICEKLGIGQSAVVSPARSMSAQQLQEYETANYQRLEYALIQCILVNYPSCGLRRPAGLPQHDAEGQYRRTAYKEAYGVVYFYIFDRESSYDGQRQERFSTVSVQDMIRRLNDTLPNYCIQSGLLPCSIIDAKNLDNARVLFAVAEGGKGRI